MSAEELVGKSVVLRGLSRDQRKDCREATRLPPAIAMVERVLSDGRLFVRLSMGRGGMGRQRRWSAKGRVCALINVVREATAREVSLGLPVGVLAPAVNS